MDLVERAKRILLQPGREWLATEAESATTAGLYKSYIVPLAAIVLFTVISIVSGAFLSYAGSSLN